MKWLKKAENRNEPAFGDLRIIHQGASALFVEVRLVFLKCIVGYFIHNYVSRRYDNRVQP